jgi:ribonuclease-3
MRGCSRTLAQALPTAILGYQFKDKTLLEAALTHPSSTDALQANLRLRHQRLEFFGDAVWSFYVSDALISLWPEASEGELTLRRARLISAAALSEMARTHGLPPLIKLSRGEASSGGRERASVLSSVFEAVIGAIYLDGGKEEIRRFARRVCSEGTGEKEIAHDPKTRLQHFTQSRFRSVPRYCLVRRCGPPHAPTFEIEVRIGESPIGRGIGRTRRQAELEAALQALACLPTLLSTTSSSHFFLNH